MTTLVPAPTTGDATAVERHGSVRDQRAPKRSSSRPQARTDQAAAVAEAQSLLGDSGRSRDEQLEHGGGVLAVDREWHTIGALGFPRWCGIPKHRVVELVHLRHANYGLRWTTPSVLDVQRRRRLEQTADPLATVTVSSTSTPTCVVGPHWWLMALTWTVFFSSALLVTTLTVSEAGIGEAWMGIVLSAACLLMYALVGCTNPGIIEPLLEPVDDTYTYCDHCESYRPPSALHCFDCRVCIEEYDHHCPWTGKCIGKRNVRYFYAWLFFLVLAFVYEMIEFTTYMLPPEDRPTRAFDDDDDDDVSFARRETPSPSSPLRFLRRHL
ncbi:hypothetical protein PINS_up006475 [Pythium insidiosum]|nr:hypothetical protein PINS_up006475 [Pythium insidiosum]